MKKYDSPKRCRICRKKLKNCKGHQPPVIRISEPTFSSAKVVFEQQKQEDPGGYERGMGFGSGYEY